MNIQELVILYEPDMLRLAPGYLITWYMDNELISMEAAWKWYPEFASYIGYN